MQCLCLVRPREITSLLSHINLCSQYSLPAPSYFEVKIVIEFRLFFCVCNVFFVGFHYFFGQVFFAVLKYHDSNAWGDLPRSIKHMNGPV